MCVDYMQILQCFIKGTWASTDFVIHGGPGINPLQITRYDCNIFVNIEVQGKLVSRYAGHSSAHLLNLAFKFNEEFPDGKVKKEIELVMRFLQRGIFAVAPVPLYKNLFKNLLVIRLCPIFLWIRVFPYPT